MDCQEGLNQMIKDNQKVDCVITSPPYWSLRDYNIKPTIWDGDPNCKHNWNKHNIGDKSGDGHYTGTIRWQHIAKTSQEKGIHVRDVKKGAWEKGGFDSYFCSKCGCYDNKTEILTNNGWKLFKNLRKLDKVASLEDGFLKFVEPQTYYEYDWNNKLIHFYGQNIDLCVTPNHNMYVQKRSYKNKKEFFYDFDFIQAEFTKIGYKIKRNLKWKGKKIQYFEIPKIQTRFNNHKKVDTIKIEDWLEFLGLWLAEGYVYKRLRKYPEYFTAITQTKKRKEVEAILDKLPFSYSYTRNKDYVIYNKQLSLYLIKLGKTKSKYIPKEVKNLSPILLTHFLKGYLIGDGHIRKDGRIEASTISKKLADDLQEVGFKIGYVSSISEKTDKRQNRSKLYRIPFIKNQKITRITHKEKINYEGKVYCVEVSSHILLIRRDGKVCWCGNSWRGTLGLESNFELYIKHLCDIYDLIWEVLKDSGTNWVNMGDAYSSGSTLTMQQRIQLEKHSNSKLTKLKKPKFKLENYAQKCLLMLPQRFAIEMINRGWILRNTIIWHKPNAMPSSAKDRFTIDFEYIYLFVKSSKNQYWINEKTSQSISKHPLGTKGIENIDWGWRECPKCFGTGIKHKKCKDCDGDGWFYSTLLQIEECQYCKGLGRINQNEECKSCKGKGIKKYNFWSGRQYYFEQQLEKANTEIIFSRDSKKGGVQEVNNPRISWGNTREELRERGFKIKNDKIKDPQYHGQDIEYPTLIRNKRTVWTITTQPNPEAHFATFPNKLVEPMIKAGCPEFVCSKCEKPREKQYKLLTNPKGKKASEFAKENIEIGRAFNKSQFSARCIPTDRSCGNPSPRDFKGYSDCGCNAKFISGVVLDPFGGIGTTSKVAYSLGRNYISFEISKQYCDIFNKWYKNQSIRLDKWIEVDP